MDSDSESQPEITFRSLSLRFALSLALFFASPRSNRTENESLISYARRGLLARLNLEFDAL